MAYGSAEGSCFAVPEKPLHYTDRTESPKNPQLGVPLLNKWAS